jgi:hypothetical protein
MPWSYYPSVNDLIKRDTEPVHDKISRLIAEYQSVCAGGCKSPGSFASLILRRLCGRMLRTLALPVRLLQISNDGCEYLLEVVRSR